MLVYAGRGPLTGKERRRTATARSRKEAEQLRTRLLSEIDQGRAASGGSRATMTQLLERWLDTADLEMTTRHTYHGYSSNKIVPALGRVPVRKVDVETLDRFYAELRKRGGAQGQPLAAMTVRQVHFIVRAALGLAVKWGWVPRNPAEDATIPATSAKTSPRQHHRRSSSSWPPPGTTTPTWARCCGWRWSPARGAVRPALDPRASTRRVCAHLPQVEFRTFGVLAACRCQRQGVELCGSGECVDEGAGDF